MLSDLKVMDQMYFLDLTEKSLWDELNVYIGQVSKLISTKFQPNSLIFDHVSERKLFFKKIHDVEENVWMPKSSRHWNYAKKFELFFFSLQIRRPWQNRSYLRGFRSKIKTKNVTVGTENRSHHRQCRAQRTSMIIDSDLGGRLPKNFLQKLTI